MVSLRFLREQQEAEARRARFEAARQMANTFEVQRARAYASQKTLQAQRVRRDARRAWECEQQRQAALIDRVLYEGQAKQGEGMQAAAAMQISLRQHAGSEVAAWEGEHALAEERHRLALATEIVTRAIRNHEKNYCVGRRREVRAAEDKYSKEIISRQRQRTSPVFGASPTHPMNTISTLTTKTGIGKTTRGSSPLTGALSHTAIPRLRQEEKEKFRRAAAAVIVVPRENSNNNNKEEEEEEKEKEEENTATRGDVAAVEYTKERQRELASAEAAVQEAQRAAAVRATALLSQREEEKRKEREVIKRRAANVEALEQKRHTNIKTTEAEEQNEGFNIAREEEARRAAALMAQEEAEFEAIFLRGQLTPTVVNTRNTRIVNMELEREEDAVRYFELANVSSSFLPNDTDILVRLPPARPLDVRPEISVEEDNKGGNNNNNNNNNYNYNDDDDDVGTETGSEAPTAASAAPQPTPLPMSTRTTTTSSTALASSPASLTYQVTAENKEIEPITIATVLSPSIPETKAKTKTPVKESEEIQSSDGSPCLEQHHEQFLKNLKNLQEKLEKAATAAAVSSSTTDTTTTNTNTTTTTTTTTEEDNNVEYSACHANVSLSSMSSMFTPSRLPIRNDGQSEEETGASEFDTSGSSSSTLLSSHYSRPYPTMTAEQLKSALLRMKLRMKSA